MLAKTISSPEQPQWHQWSRCIATCAMGTLRKESSKSFIWWSDLCLRMSSCVHWPEKGKSSNRKKALCFPSCQVCHPWTLHCHPIISVTNDSYHYLYCTELILFSMVTTEIKLKLGAFEAKLNMKLLLNCRRGLLKHFLLNHGSTIYVIKNSDIRCIDGSIRINC